RCNFGEIDVVARDLDKNEIVFIEVKTRKSKTYGDASEAIDYYKKKHIIKSAEYFVWINRLENEYIRIDVIEVYLGKNSKPRINHIKQAFY
ncbi:MAG: YraN family protein, partial [Firmicutes bacterium]|nr:YraN family protein [Bacillota bacterium]